jgi:hypothetical protein
MFHSTGRGKASFLLWRAPQQMLRTHRSLKAYCATLWWRWLLFFSFIRIMEHRWNEIDRGKPIPMPLCPPQIPHGLTPGSNPGLRGERPANNRLNHGTAKQVLSHLFWLPLRIKTVRRNIRWDLRFFWDFTQFRMVVSYRCFGITYRSHLQGSSSRKRIIIGLQPGNRLSWRLSWFYSVIVGEFLVFILWLDSPRGPLHLWSFEITLRHITFRGTPLDEWSARRRDL